jgi:hypothetical protein
MCLTTRNCLFNGEEVFLPQERIGHYRKKWSSLPEFVKEFVSTTYQRFKAFYPGVREKFPKAIAGLEGVYSPQTPVGVHLKS